MTFTERVVRETGRLVDRSQVAPFGFAAFGALVGGAAVVLVRALRG